MIHHGAVPLGSVLPFVFGTYDGATGASEAATGLAVTDIEIYKGSSVTQRSSDNGYALIDTDGLDIDGITGINGFTVDTGDNSDAGFFVSGSYYTVVVSSITADGQTVSFVAGTFRLVEPFTAVVPVQYRKYNVLLVTGTTAIKLPISKVGGGLAGSGDWTPSANGGGAGASDVLVSGDGGTLTNVTNLPTFNDGWELILTAAELSAKSVDVRVIDASNPKVIGDVWIHIETFGNASAMYPDDWSASSGTAQTGDAYARLGAPAGASTAADIAAISALIGALNVAASSGDPGSATTLVAYLKQLVNTLEGTAGVVTFPAAANPGNAVSLAEVIRSIHANVGAPTNLGGGGGATIAGNLVDIEAQTDDIGAAGAGLTAADDAILAAIAALNNLSSAQVQTVLTNCGITAAGGITRIASQDIQVGGSNPASPIGKV